MNKTKMEMIPTKLHRIVLILSIAALLALAGCTESTAPLPETTIPEQTVTVANPAPTTEPTEPMSEPQPESPEDWESAKVKFERILWDEDIFFNRDQAQEMTLNQFCQHLGAVAEAEVSISSYALADLDGNGIPELLLGIVFNDEFAYGTLVLRYGDGVTGYEFTYRQLMDIKQDGTFHFSGGAADNGIARLRFTDDGWEYNVLGGVESSGEEITYFWDGQQVDQGTYNDHVDTHYFKPDAVRTPYPGEQRTLTLQVTE